jgi:hypothetical protein
VTGGSGALPGQRLGAWMVRGGTLDQSKSAPASSGHPIYPAARIETAWSSQLARTRLVTVKRDVSLEQQELRGDIEIVRRYGEAHPEAWVELRYENEPAVRIVALFAGDQLALHEDALLHLVAHPDQLELRSSPWPKSELEEIRAEIHAMARSSDSGLFSGWGVGRGKVNVTLRADGARVAKQLQERYGEAVDLTVGFLHFPECAMSEWLAGLSDSVPPRPPFLTHQLRVTTDVNLEVRSGTNLSSAIRLVNKGTAEVVVSTNGGLTGRVLDPETNEIVGGYSGAQPLPLVRFSAPAGGSVEIPMLVGTASTVPRLGYAVPPGQWAVEIVLPLGDQGVFRAPPIPFNVLP